MSHILIIDDDPPLRRVMRNILERAGHVVREAANGREGMAMYRQASPDVVVTDIFMPEKDGIQILMDLKQTSGGSKIIVMTGGDPGDLFGLQSSACLLGADRVLSKPFDTQTFLLTVEGVLKSMPGLPNQTDVDEQRKYPRFPIVLPALFGDGVCAQTGTVVDISHEGCRIRSTDGVPGVKYFQVEIQLAGPAERLTVDLAVMRWSRQGEFGVEFIRMAPESQAQLRRIVQSCEETCAKLQGCEGVPQPICDRSHRAPSQT
jgi:CheY-like chemotaxis protein